MKINNNGTLVIKAEHGNIVVKNKELIEDFFDWINHECDGEEPNEILFNEFLEMESLRDSLIKNIKNSLI